MDIAPRTFQLTSDYIELDNLLKATGLVSNGAEAKVAIRKGDVQVNGVPETRVRRKLRAGDQVVWQGERVLLREAGAGK